MRQIPLKLERVATVAAQGHRLLALIRVVKQWVTTSLSQPTPHGGQGPIQRCRGGTAWDPIAHTRCKVYHVISLVVVVQLEWASACPIARNGQRVLRCARRPVSIGTHDLDRLESNCTRCLVKTRQRQVQLCCTGRVYVLAASITRGLCSAGVANTGIAFEMIRLPT